MFRKFVGFAVSGMTRKFFRKHSILEGILRREGHFDFRGVSCNWLQVKKILGIFNESDQIPRCAFMVLFEREKMRY